LEVLKLNNLPDHRKQSRHRSFNGLDLDSLRGRSRSWCGCGVGVGAAGCAGMIMLLPMFNSPAL
jgi:hypothetical protein